MTVGAYTYILYTHAHKKYICMYKYFHDCYAKLSHINFIYVQIILIVCMCGTKSVRINASATNNKTATPPSLTPASSAY